MAPTADHPNPPPIPARTTSRPAGTGMLGTILIAVLAAVLASAGTAVVFVLLTRRPAPLIDQKPAIERAPAATSQVEARPVLMPDWSHWEFDRKIPFDLCKPNCAAFSRSGQTIAVSGGNLNERGAWRIIDVESLAVKLTITAPDYGLQAIEFYPDGSSIAVSTWTYGPENRTNVYDATTGAMKFSVYGMAQAIAFHPTGKYFAISYGGTLWDALSGQGRNGPCKSHHEFPAFSPDGTLLYADGHLWVLDSGEQIGEWKTDRGAFTHDSRFLGMPSAVWDVKARSPVWEDNTPIKRGFTAAIAFSPDDRLLLVAMHTGQIAIRESATGRELQRFEASRGANAIAISPDGRFMATVERDEGVKLWRASLRESPAKKRVP